MLDKIRRYVHIGCDIIELFLAFMVAVALVIAVIKFIPEFKDYVISFHGTEMFLEVLEEIFSLVVGIEFIKMLCKPNTDNVIEALVFLVARHMVIGTNSAIDNLFSIISIGILFLVKAFVHDQKRKHKLASDARVQVENKE